MPAGEFWDSFCSGSPRPNCTTDTGYDTAGPRNYVSVLGASIQQALARDDKPRYVYLHYSGFADDSNTNRARNHVDVVRKSYLPIYTSSRGPLTGTRTFLQDVMSHLGAAVWQGGPPDSGADQRSVVVVPAGFDRRNSRIVRAPPSWPCANWDSTQSAQRDCVRAGGHGADNPRILGMLPRIAELVAGDPSKDDLAATFLTVVGVDTDSRDATHSQARIHADSNHCGDAAAWCLAAPVNNLRTQAHGSAGGFSAQFGTEYAASVVVGALALVDSAFNPGETPSVSPVAIRQRLLDTASDEGIYATTATYGHGLLDIEAALSPQGTGAMPSPPRLGLTGAVQAGVGLPLGGLTLALPGHALSMLGGTRVMTLDSHGFPFYLQLRDLAHAPLAQAAPFAAVAMQGPASVVRSPSGLLHISAGVDSGAAWGSALTPQHLVQGGQIGGLAAGAHLAASPLLASSLESYGAGHVAVRANFGQQSIAAMACTQRHAERDQDSVQGNGANACMALGWDWNRGESFGLSVRTHVLDSRGGLYRYGTRCFGGACAGGGATATELGLGGFAKLSGGLRLGWNWWHGWADDIDGGSDLVRYAGMGHSAGSLALESADGVWSLYVQQPLRAEGSLQLVLPERRDPAGNVYFQRHHLRLDGAARPVRLGLSSRVALTGRGGYMALDLGAERGLHRHPGAHPYLALQTSIPW